MAKKNLEECLKEFCWRGVTVVPFCPGCMTNLLTESDLWTISKNIKKCHLNDLYQSPKLAEEVLSGFFFVVSKHLISKPTALAFFVSSNEEIANLLNHRWIIYPLCYICVDKRSPKFLLMIETNLALVRRFIKHRNVTKELRKKGNERGVS